MSNNNVTTTTQNQTPEQINSTPSNQPDIAAAAVLATIKDGRYVASLVQLLSQALHPWLVSRSDSQRNNQTLSLSSINDNDMISALRPELELIAGLTHFLLTVFSSGRTLGMEYVGLEYHVNDTKAQNKTERKSFNAKGGSRFFRNLASSRIRVISFAFFYTCAPYLIRRAGRGGWDQLKTLLNRQRGQGHSARGDFSTQHPNERLRGVSRRRVYEQQRQAMLERIRTIERQQQQQQYQEPQQQAREDEISDHQLQQGSNHIQSLTEGSTHENIPQSISSLFQNSYYGRCIQTYYQRLSKLLWSLLRKLSTIEEQELNAATNTQAIPTPPNESDEPASPSHYTAALKWILRLHLALFYLNSQYPTILTHRILSLTLKNDQQTTFPFAQQSTSIRPSYRILGFLLVLQNAALFCKGSANVIMDAFYRMQIHHDMRRRRRNRIDNGNTSGIHAIVETTTEQSHSEQMVDSFSASVEHIVPSMNSSHVLNGRNLPSNYSNRSANLGSTLHGSNNSTIMSCALCMSDRTSPSVAPCGHVFCWKCIQNWCTNVRPECPLCRSHCLPQSVIALWNMK